MVHQVKKKRWEVKVYFEGTEKQVENLSNKILKLPGVEDVDAPWAWEEEMEEMN